MTQSTKKTIAKIKLAEMRRQRERLTEHYNNVTADAQSATTNLERLRILYNGLRNTRFTGKSLHPDVGPLDVLLFEDEVGKHSPQMVDNWLQQLQRELLRGRLRAEHTCAFGQILDDWKQADSNKPPHDDPQPWRLLLQSPAKQANAQYLRDLFGKYASFFTPLKNAMTEFGDKDAMAPVSIDEVKALLNHQARDDFRQYPLRKAALSALSDATACNEIADTISILLNNLDDWQWPSEGETPISTWKNQKWRPYLQEDLIHLLFVQLIGLRWGMALKRQTQSLFSHGWEQESLFWRKKWNRWPQPQQEMRAQKNNAAQMFLLSMIPASLQNWVNASGYGAGYTSNKSIDLQPTQLERLLIEVHADIRMHQLLEPDKAVHIIQIDLKDYYLQIPHHIIEAMLEELGVPGRWQQFFAKYLSIPLVVDDGIASSKRGFILGHLIGSVLADYLLFLLEVHLFQETEIRLLRVIDDMFVVCNDSQQTTRAWSLINEFCQTCGLEINAEKSGATNLGDQKDGSLLPGLPRWGLLQLHDDGQWHIDSALFETLQKRIAAEVQGTPSIIGKVKCYNENVAYLHKNLGLTAPINLPRYEEIGKHLSRLHQHLFGENHGMAEEIHRQLASCFLDAQLQEQGLPESLLYWPITAGGLGLTHPLIPVVAHRNALQEKLPVAPNREGPYAPNDSYCSRVYQYGYQVRSAVTMEGPNATPGMERLVDDFIARGGEVGGRQQQGLSKYWRWVIYTYGPALLEEMGTFRFLLTELVPLQMIFDGQSRQDTTAATNDSFAGDAGDEIPF